MEEIRYLISDASKKVDVETHVLRYWEEELGLSIPRNEMGHRYYTEFHIRLFCQVKKLKDKGYQLKAIKSALQQVMSQNQGVMAAAGVLELDMSRTLQENQQLGSLRPMMTDKPLEEPGTGAAENLWGQSEIQDHHLTDYNRLEPENPPFLIDQETTGQDVFIKESAGERKIGRGEIDREKINRENTNKEEIDKEKIEDHSESRGQGGRQAIGRQEIQREERIIPDTAEQKITGQVRNEIPKNQKIQEAENIEEETKKKQNKETKIESDMESKMESIQENGKKDGQADMKNRGRERKKPSAWERRNGMVAGARESMETAREPMRTNSEEMEEAEGESMSEMTALAVSGSGELAEGIERDDGREELSVMTQEEKMEQFQAIMNHIIERALEVNNEKLSQDISGLVNERLTEELEDLMRIRDEREEERYRQIDEIIRSCQRDSQGKAEAAATRIPFFRKRRFGRNGKHLKSV